MKLKWIMSWFKGIKGRLLLSGVIPIITFAISTVIASKNMGSLGSMLNESYTVIAPNLASLSRINVGRSSMSDGFHKVLIHSENNELHDKSLAYSESNLARVKTHLENYENSSKLAGEEELYAPAKKAKDAFVKDSAAIIALLKLNTPEANAEAKALMSGEWLKNSITIDASIESLLGFYDDTATMRLIEQDEKRTQAFNLLILVGLISVFVVLASLAWTAFSVSRSVQKISDSLTTSGAQVNDSISELSTAGQTLSHSSTTAAASLEETVASLEELTSMVQMNSDNAKQAASLSHSSRDAAERGEKEIRELVTSMQDISQSSKKIEEIIHVIDDIAFQTNLLALNASVEAARAGEHGKGFAVVADAVRTLAQRSATAAKDINVLIKESVSKIDNGTSIADNSGIVMNDIVTSVKKVSDLANEIAAASSEQTVGIQQISKAMNQLDQGAQGNAASAEKVANTAGEISGQASNMRELVHQLNTVVTGYAENETALKPVEVKKEKIKQNVKQSVSAKIIPLKNNQNNSKLNKTAQPMPTSKKVSAPVSQAPMKKAASSDVIPFDDDDRGGVSDTSGF